MYRKWTTEDDEKIRRMAAEGKTAGQVAIALKGSRNSVIGRASRIGVTFGGTSIRVERKADRDRRAHEREMSALKKAAGITFIKNGAEIDSDARRLMEMIPDDTRSLSGRMFGDPLPDRSASRRLVEPSPPISMPEPDSRIYTVEKRQFITLGVAAPRMMSVSLPYVSIQHGGSK